jgi:hypothetical protein
MFFLLDEVPEPACPKSAEVVEGRTLVISVSVLGLLSSDLGPPSSVALRFCPLSSAICHQSSVFLTFNEIRHILPPMMNLKPEG